MLISFECRRGGEYLSPPNPDLENAETEMGGKKLTQNPEESLWGPLRNHSEAAPVHTLARLT